jgi:GMP synthase (glutamine-hydrolysing)
MSKRDHIAIIDLGGQYCHLIARRLRDLNVESDIFDPGVFAEKVSDYAGFILSGGPQSVYDPSALSIDARILTLGLPILGICYGHQLLAKLLGGEVAQQDGEYGFAQLTAETSDALLRNTPARQQVWMSHSDAVRVLPAGAATMASTPRCEHAAFADVSRRIFGVQFHPEVVHTEYGTQILENFVRSICSIQTKMDSSNRVKTLCEKIQDRAADKSVFFLVSGGVDSTVAFVLCGMALSSERVVGLYVDTGLMRQGETEELRVNLEKLGLEERLKVWDASEVFLKALEGKTDPEEKRQIIGRLFVEIQSQAMREFKIDPASWLLGQGTIYPDTIESGGESGRAAVIKTHHNRCEEIRELIRQGRVIEPLAEFYKDEVRQIGRELGLSPQLTEGWPFPGPGLAIRCIGAQAEESAVALPPDVSTTLEAAKYRGVLLPLRSVGVQGDARTYRKLVALEKVEGPIEYEVLRTLSSSLCNENTEANRVVLLLGGKGRLPDARIRPATITRNRVETLRKADYLVRSEMERTASVSAVWQFPVVLAPISFDGGESVILRPVNSVDGMTASFANLSPTLLHRIADAILKVPGVDAVFLDATNKPPATIEWE